MDGSLWIAVSGILVAHALAVMSPGPSFVLVARRAASVSRGDGVLTALGMGSGAAIWAAGAMYGLQAVLSRFQYLGVGLQIAGGVFLLYVAWMSWKHAGAPLPMADAAANGRSGVLRSYGMGLAMQLSNPKVVIFFSSIFLALLPSQVPLWLQLVIIALIFAVDAGWYVVVAVAFSNRAARAAYERSKATADRLTGGLLGILGVRLLLNARG